MGRCSARELIILCKRRPSMMKIGSVDGWTTKYMLGHRVSLFRSPCVSLRDSPLFLGRTKDFFKTLDYRSVATLKLPTLHVDYLLSLMLQSSTN